ncbi:meiosis expressed gene 1 protein homolog [Tiliqua scincoides]|uniref:meiosis expressed gene 1 protein homolog n=1 Tax=Tiliqua scincoides TaxID=71010 RepID=UPI0034627FE0
MDGEEAPGRAAAGQTPRAEPERAPPGASGAAAGSEAKPRAARRAQTWSDEVENLYRFQQAGYRDEAEYKRVRQVDTVDRWPETGFVKKLQRRDNTFYYYDKERECEDKEVRKVKVYAY